MSENRNSTLRHDTQEHTNSQKQNNPFSEQEKHGDNAQRNAPRNSQEYQGDDSERNDAVVEDNAKPERKSA